MKTSQILVYHAAYTLKKIRSACTDLAPIVVVMTLFVFAIVPQPFRPKHSASGRFSPPGSMKRS